jgi:serine/threonine-protein kinase
MSANRNLLLGLIALQNNFIDRHQLVAAFDRWTHDKRLDLGTLLLENKALSTANLTLINALLEHHLQRSGGNLLASLSSIHSGAIPDELRNLPDRELQQSIVAAEGTIEPSSVGASDVVPQDTLLLSSERVTTSRFRVLRPHASGGLGEVFVAQDDELHRIVALKRIRKNYADITHHRSRFTAEAEITGALEHPGIVPVYGMGVDPDGRPYYAMRFVRGDPFQRSIDRYHTARRQGNNQGQLVVELRNLLGRFIDVCDAIGYAHSRGVLHRDLKPANILLGPFGETLVVDWGLARSIGDATPEEARSTEGLVRPFSGMGTHGTEFGSTVGTPQFMSPEQASGQLDQLGPATDVYGLGATLFYLLGGSPPVQGNTVAETLNCVQKGELRNLAELNPQLDRPLIAICMKALSLKRQDRYPRAADLANDLQHWLADEPVTAFPENIRHRGGRWFRRNHALVMFGTLATGIAVAILCVSLWQISAAREREIAAHALAEESFHAARRTVDEYFTQVSETLLLNHPGLQPVRRDLLSSAVKYYDEFLERRGNDPALRAESARAAYNLGRIDEELGQWDRAVGYYQRAHQLQQVLFSESDDELVTEALSDTLTAQARLAIKLGMFGEGLKANSEATALRQRLVDKAPLQVDLVRKLANNLMNAGLLHLKSGRFAEGETEMRRAQALREPWTRGPVSEAGPKLLIYRDLLKGHFNLGGLAAERGDSEKAREEFQTATVRAEQLLADFPNDLELRYLLSNCYRLLGDSSAGGDQPRSAIAEYERALSHLHSLTQRNPDVAEYQLGLAGVYLNLAHVYALEEKGLARHPLDEAISILRAQHAQQPNPTVARDLAVAYRERSRLKGEAEGPLALEDLRESLKLLESIKSSTVNDLGQFDYTKELEQTREMLRSRL